MKVRPSLLLAATLLAAGCNKKEAPADGDIPPGDSNGQDKNAPPEGDPTQWSSGSPDPRGVEAVDDAESQPDDPPALTDPPTKAAIQSAAVAALGAKAAKLTPTVRVGGTRFVSAWRVPDPELGHAATVHLVVVEKDPEGTWVAAHHTELLAMKTEWLDEDKPPPMAATVRGEDYDDDGEAEILVRIEEQIMCPGAGPNYVTHLLVFNLKAALARAHQSELHHRNDNGIATRGKAEHVDLNGDGHRDLRITYTTQDEHDGSKKVDVNTWLWDAKTDAYKAEKVAYTASACDW